MLHYLDHWWSEEEKLVLIVPLVFQAAVYLQRASGLLHCVCHVNALASCHLAAAFQWLLVSSYLVLIVIV